MFSWYSTARLSLQKLMFPLDARAPVSDGGRAREGLNKNSATKTIIAITQSLVDM